MINAGQIRVWRKDKTQSADSSNKPDSYFRILPNTTIFISAKTEDGICTLLFEDGTLMRRPEWMVELYSTESSLD